VRDLRVVFRARQGRNAPDATPEVPVLDGVSLAVAPGETIALVGESGAGKTVLALAVMGLLPDAMRIASGSIQLDGEELVGASARTLRAARGARMAMIFQDPLASLHPAFRVGDQIAEALRTHGRAPTKAAARARAAELLALVGVPDANARAREYPHRLSGGLRQRAMVAMAIANDPRLLIADEATTALDVTVQAQVLDVLRRARSETGAAMLLVTHDLGVVAGTADRVAVLYAGRVVEEGAVDDLLRAPRHPYTQGLLDAVPRLSGDTPPPRPIPGAPPSPYARPTGCAFHPRCPRADARCASDDPALVVDGRGAVACHYAGVRT
jgi:oligopeptide/dipeptide ABC transporter ATP-binding protein